MLERPSSAIVGPGAIGAALAGAVLQAGSTPMICARTAFSSLSVTHLGGEISGAVTCLTEPPEVTVDLVVLAVKAHQTVEAAPWLRALVGPQTTLVIAQNGVEHAERVAPYVHPEAELVPAVIWCPSQRVGPGEIRVNGDARLLVPEGDGAELLARLVAGSFFEIRTTTDWQSRAWDKLLVNAAMGGVGALTGRPGSDLAEDPTIRELLLALMNETVAVGRAEGATIPDGRVEQILDAMAGVSHVSSIAVDRGNGVPTEWDARNQVVERLADRHGIDVPLNRWLTALIRMGEPTSTALD